MRTGLTKIGNPNTNSNSTGLILEVRLTRTWQTRRNLNRRIMEPNSHRSRLKPKQISVAVFSISLVICFVTSFGIRSLRGDEAAIDLSGQWTVVLDTKDQIESPKELKDEAKDIGFGYPLNLPGSLTDANIGNHIGPNTSLVLSRPWFLEGQPQYEPYQTERDFKFPFSWQANKSFLGPAWYQREIVIPESWQGHRMELTLERPHFQTRVWLNQTRLSGLALDGNHIDSVNSLGTSHQYVTNAPIVSGAHTLTICVDNRIRDLDVGIDAHSLSDQTQTCWNGIVGRIEIRRQSEIEIKQVEVHPNTDAKHATLKISINNFSGKARSQVLLLQAFQGESSIGTATLDVEVAPGIQNISVKLPFSKTLETWDEFKPNLCRLIAKIENKHPVKETSSKFETTFARRSVAVDGNRLLLNGHPLFLRGTLECCIFPLTGYPPTDVASWTQIFQVCKEYGLNHMRFHSWCPPEAAMVAADKIGFYLQLECSAWPSNSAQVGVGMPIDPWLYVEAERMLSQYGNHPSFLMLALGNEPEVTPQSKAYLSSWAEHFNDRDDRVLVTSGVGWPSLPENQYEVHSVPRIQQWGQGLSNRLNREPPSTVFDYRTSIAKSVRPVISHEAGQWCAFPNLNESQKYTGSLRFRGYEIYHDFLQTSGLLNQADDFVMASGKLQLVCYKEEIESLLRTPNLSGFQLLDIRDFPGQGTAPVGVLDPFWDAKPYADVQSYRKFCGPAIPLARMPKRTLSNQEPFKADVEISLHGAARWTDVNAQWWLKQQDHVIGSGKFDVDTLEQGKNSLLGTVQAELSEINEASALRFIVAVSGDQAGSNESVSNDWNVWVYPESVLSGPGKNVDNQQFLVTDRFTDEVADKLERGATVFLTPNRNSLASTETLAFTPIFWNSAWTNRSPPTTLGILCDPSHPAFARFPTDLHSDWQWWDVINRSGLIELDGFSPDLKPIIQVVPDWHNPKRLAIAFEAAVGSGKLLMCAIDFPKARALGLPSDQLKHSLLDYARSPKFDPKVQVSVDEIRDCFLSLPQAVRISATISSGNHAAGFAPENAVDGSTKTIWHSSWNDTLSEQPDWIAFDLHQPMNLSGIRYVPRQDMSNGRIKRYEVWTSVSGDNWQRSAIGQWENDSVTKVVIFDSVVKARFVQLRAISEVNGKPHTSAAEFDVILAKPTDLIE
jgi:hypothetical protein